MNFSKLIMNCSKLTMNFLNLSEFELLENLNFLKNNYFEINLILFFIILTFLICFKQLFNDYKKYQQTTNETKKYQQITDQVINYDEKEYLNEIDIKYNDLIFLLFIHLYQSNIILNYEKDILYQSNIILNYEKDINKLNAYIKDQENKLDIITENIISDYKKDLDELKQYIKELEIEIENVEIEIEDKKNCIYSFEEDLHLSRLKMLESYLQKFEDENKKNNFKFFFDKCGYIPIRCKSKKCIPLICLYMHEYSNEKCSINNCEEILCKKYHVKCKIELDNGECRIYSCNYVHVNDFWGRYIM